MSVDVISWAVDQPTPSPTAKLILMLLANFADDDGVCWPRQITLAKQAGCAPETVCRLMKQLEDLGFISRRVKTVSGARKLFYYIIPFKTDDVASAKINPKKDYRKAQYSESAPRPTRAEIDECRRDAAERSRRLSHPDHDQDVDEASISRVTSGHPGHDDTSIENGTPTQIPMDMTSIARSTSDQSVYKDEPSEEPSYTRSRVEDDFERFWKTYPSRGKNPNPKAPARTKFVRAVKNGADPEQMIRAAAEYAELMKGRDPVFVCHATTWLNQRRWEDESPPQPQEPLAWH